jgi:intracellular sulfur oxidation DsrE/DsrF family protein
MNGKETFSDEFLNAFVDNQLDPEEKTQVYSVISEDEGLNRRVCELRKIRDLVQLAFTNIPSGGRLTPGGGSRARFGFRVAASLLLAVGAALGWLLHQPNGSQLVAAGNDANARQVAALQAHKGAKVLLHLNSGDPARMKETLDEAEELLKYYQRRHETARVEVLTNGAGLNLLRRDTSPFSVRIKQMYQRYNNLVFVACQNTIDRLKREQGVIAQLLPEAVVIDSAVAQIMRRQQQGWAYIQV